MDVLVTGGCGYIGSALVPTLRAAESVDRVVVLDSLASGSPRALLGTLDPQDEASDAPADDASGGDASGGDTSGGGDGPVADPIAAPVTGPGVDFRQGDVREYGDVESAMRGVDRVIHLAAITGASSTHDRRAETFAVNLDGTENVLTAAGKLGIDGVVFASSCNIYGRATSTEIDESTEPDPINPYAEAKAEAESLVESACEEYGMDGTSLRMSTNYGYAPGVRFNLVVNHFVFRALTGRPLTVYGDGSNWRPFVHVEDAARAYADAVLRPGAWSAPAYNVGSDAGNYRIADVAAVVREEVGPVDVTYLEDEHPGPSYHVDFARLAETGFEPGWTLREGVRDLAREFAEGAHA